MVQQLHVKPRMSRVICIIGMDGTGKTTHSRLLRAHLEESGEKSKYLWFGTARFLSYPFMVICRALGFTNVNHLANGLAVSEHQYYKNHPISSIWPWVQLLDLLVLANVRMRLKLLCKFTVICDRFIPDILVELMDDVNDDRLHNKLIGRLMLRIMPRSSLVILLSTDEKTAWKRKNDIPGLEYLSRRKHYYCLMKRDLGIPSVDSGGSIACVQQRLISLVDGSLRKPSA